MSNNPARHHKRTMRAFRERYGDAPWPCAECGELIYELGYQTGNVHHIDHDAGNDDPMNLEPLHPRCHIARKHPITDEMKVQISEKLKGRPSPTKGMKFSPEVNAKKAQPGDRNGFYGKQHTVADLEKMRRPRRRAHCDDCNKDWALNWIIRHKEAGRCV